jgi:hypothetical protein
VTAWPESAGEAGDEAVVARRHNNGGAGRRKVAGFAVFTFAFHKEGRYWVGECLELGTATDGRTLEKVDDELTRLVSLHLEALEDIGERERFFRERNVKFFTGEIPAQITGEIPVTRETAPMVHMKPIAVEDLVEDPSDDLIRA